MLDETKLELLTELRTAWELHPEWSFCQLVANTIKCTPDYLHYAPLHHVPDKQFGTAVKEFKTVR